MKGWHGRIQDLPIEKLDEIIEQTELKIESRQIDLKCFKKIREDKNKGKQQSVSYAGGLHESVSNTNLECGAELSDANPVDFNRHHAEMVELITAVHEWATDVLNVDVIDLLVDAGMANGDTYELKI